MKNIDLRQCNINMIIAMDHYGITNLITSQLDKTLRGSGKSNTFSFVHGKIDGPLLFIPSLKWHEHKTAVGEGKVSALLQCKYKI